MVREIQVIRRAQRWVSPYPELLLLFGLCGLESSHLYRFKKDLSTFRSLGSSRPYAYLIGIPNISSEDLSAGSTQL